MKKIKLDKINKICRRLSELYSLYVPAEENESSGFYKWDEETDINMSLLRTAKPPKDIVFPQKENLVSFEKNDDLKIEVAEKAPEKTAVLGIRTCDLTAFELMDRVFLQEPEDRFYRLRRDNTVMIALGCLDSAETCFCRGFDIQPEKMPEAADVMIWKLGDNLLWQTGSPEGEELTAEFSDLLEDAAEEDRKKLVEKQKLAEEKHEDSPLSELEPEGITERIEEVFELPIWDEIHRRCLQCGICTYICPTCHCYDIQDYKTSGGGERYRCWDSCQFSAFTRMAHGNPRPTPRERVRQRFMHKLVYYSREHGEASCVGCGRCVENCPVELDIVEVIRRLGGENDE